MFYVCQITALLGKEKREKCHAFIHSRYDLPMLHRVFVQVVGFSGVERHALNTIFRLSQDHQSAREWSFEPWQSDSPSVARLALIDGASPDASEALAQLEAIGGVGIIWVGAISPAKAWASFQRPIVWPAILASMDEYFTPRDQLDVDLGGDTWPAVLEAAGSLVFPQPNQRKVLLADANADTRLYLRTKLASYGVTDILEATNCAEAMRFLTQDNSPNAHYDIVLVDLNLPGGNPWTVLASSRQALLKLVTQSGLTLGNRITAKVNGAVALNKPLDPSRLNELLAQIR